MPYVVQHLQMSKSVRVTKAVIKYNLALLTIKIILTILISSIDSNQFLDENAKSPFI